MASPTLQVHLRSINCFTEQWLEQEYSNIKESSEFELVVRGGICKQHYLCHICECGDVMVEFHNGRPWNRGSQKTANEIQKSIVESRILKPWVCANKLSTDIEIINRHPPTLESIDQRAESRWLLTLDTFDSTNNEERYELLSVIIHGEGSNCRSNASNVLHHLTMAYPDFITFFLKQFLLNEILAQPLAHSCKSQTIVNNKLLDKLMSRLQPITFDQFLEVSYEPEFKVIRDYLHGGFHMHRRANRIIQEHISLCISEQEFIGQGSQRLAKTLDLINSCTKESAWNIILILLRRNFRYEARSDLNGIELNRELNWDEQLDKLMELLDEPIKEFVKEKHIEQMELREKDPLVTTQMQRKVELVVQEARSAVVFQCECSGIESMLNMSLDEVVEKLNQGESVVFSINEKHECRRYFAHCTPGHGVVVRLYEGVNREGVADSESIAIEGYLINNPHLNRKILTSMIMRQKERFKVLSYSGVKSLSSTIWLPYFKRMSEIQKHQYLTDLIEKKSILNQIKSLVHLEH